MMRQNFKELVIRKLAELSKSIDEYTEDFNRNQKIYKKGSNQK